MFKVNISQIGLLICLLSGVLCCKSKDKEDHEPPPQLDHEQRSASIIEEDELKDDEDDRLEAFSDLEDEDVLCQGYQQKQVKQIMPSAVIFGVRKGGTRALLEFINMHSLVRRSESEVHFYDKHFNKGVDWYISQMPEVAEGQIAMEKTPGYFHNPLAPKRLFDTKNDTKLLLIVRDPVKRLLSDYNQFYHNHLKNGSAYPPIEQLVLDKDGAVNENYPPLQRSLYHKHMEKWLTYFPLDQMYIVNGEKFIKEPWTEMSQVEKFLGIPPEIDENSFYFNQTKGFYCGRQTIENLNSGWSCTRNKCLSKSKGRKPPVVADDVLARLYTFMEPYNHLFFNMINRTDFEWRKK